MHSKYTDFSHLASKIFSTIPHGIRVEGSISLGRDVIGWRYSKNTGETLRENVVVRQFAWATNGILAGADRELDLTNKENDSEMKKVVEQRKLHRMAKVHNFLEMWQRSRILHTTEKESHAQNKLMTVIRYTTNTEEIVKPFWSHFPLDGADAFKLLERSRLSPSLSAKDYPGGRTEI